MSLRCNVAKSPKGGNYEREICRYLSLYWTHGLRDDIFWRTKGSGGRAKTRGRKGQSTFGQHSDVYAIDPKGLPFIDVFTTEIKRGYSKFSPFDVLDKPNKNVKQTVEQWLDQVQEAVHQSGSLTYLIIFRRDKRKAIAAFNPMLYNLLDHKERKSLKKCNRMALKVDDTSMIFTLLEDFLHVVTPETVIRISKL